MKYLKVFKLNPAGKLLWYISIIIYITIFITFFIITYPHLTDNYCKKYLIGNSNSMSKDKYYMYDKGVNSYALALDSNNYSYYTDMTCTLIDDSTYQIIFWGNRDSWKWNIKKDKCLIVDIPYERYRGKDVSLDIEVLKAIKKSK